MNKLLLGTTALLGMAGAAHAAGPQVTVGGHIDFQAGIVSQDLDTPALASTKTRDLVFQNDTEVHFNIDGKSDTGLGYGAVIELEADVTSDADSEGVNADKTYVYLEGAWGRSEMGNTANAGQTMKVDTSSFAHGTGGADGDWYDFVNFGGMSYIAAPDLPLAYGTSITEDATKIVYYTPRFSGIQLGVSYTPDSGNGGTAAGFTSELNPGQWESVFEAGANYEAQYNNVGVALSATTQFGDSEVTAEEDLSAWNVGGSLTFSNFTVGGSYGDWDDVTMGGTNWTDGNYFDVGAAYSYGPFGISAAYFSGSYEVTGTGDYDADTVTVGTDYQLAPGLMPYAEVTFFELDAPGTASDNDGTVVLVGTELTF